MLTCSVDLRVDDERVYELITSRSTVKVTVSLAIVRWSIVEKVDELVDNLGESLMSMLTLNGHSKE